MTMRDEMLRTLKIRRMPGMREAEDPIDDPIGDHSQSGLDAGLDHIAPDEREGSVLLVKFWSAGEVPHHEIEEHPTESGGIEASRITDADEVLLIRDWDWLKEMDTEVDLDDFDAGAHISDEFDDVEGPPVGPGNRSSSPGGGQRHRDSYDY